MTDRTPCPTCGHPVYGRMVKCLYCGRAAAGVTQPRRPCPRCRRGLATVPTQWFLIDRCDRCRGEFYDVGEVDPRLDLDRGDRRWLEEHMEPAPHDAPGGKALECPGCRAAMDTFRVPGPQPVTIDVCPKCRGTWLDAGELERMRADARAQIVPKDVPSKTPVRAAPSPSGAPAADRDGPVESVFGAIREIVDILRGKS